MEGTQMTPITCTLVDPFVTIFNAVLALLTQFLGPLGLTAILTPVSDLAGLIRGLAGCP